MDSKQRGKLKIFFGYAPGVGKTYAMLRGARSAVRGNVDVMVGCLEPSQSPELQALRKEIPELPPAPGGEFDLDGALQRRPGLLLVEDMAHTNAPGSRHQKRYQDIEELLNSGIDVCTTVDVQQIESLHDTVSSITGLEVRERIPDSFFDQADQVEIVDLEPCELMARMEGGRIRHPEEVRGFFTPEKLTALREIALRRCADRVSGSGEDYHTDEHILVCLSSSPSNAKIIRTAARMAKAFKGTFTGLFVETPDFPAMSRENLERLRANLHLAEQLGARIETVYGSDVPFQIAEFARLSNVTKIVIGRSSASKSRLLGSQSLTERLIASAPHLDIHIIPDTASNVPYRQKKYHHAHASFLDLCKTLGILILTSLVGILFDRMGVEEANIITVYVFGVLLISVLTQNRIYSLGASILSVLVFNFLFTEPRMSLQAYDKGYPITFLVMFLSALLTGSLAVKLKDHAKQSALVAFRTKILFDVNQALQHAEGRDAILRVTADQVSRLLGQGVVIYPVEEGRLTEPIAIHVEDREEALSFEERAVAGWVLRNNKHAGAGTQTFSQARCLYLAIRNNDNVYGVAGIEARDQCLDTSEKSILLSILGECGLALENDKNAREKEAAAVLAQNEQLRANLLRAISHDLRTPLTSISGNASNFLSNGDSMDEQTKRQLFTDIYDDSMWLINLVENLLSVTRLEENRLNLNMSSELVADVIEEALKHINRRSVDYRITVEHEDDFLLARMDAKLMVQVIINIVDNAIKYTPEGTHIAIRTGAREGMAEISIADNGPGIPDESKPRIFEMFYSGANKIADSRRSLGLGLSLCKSIITAHDGTITVADNPPHGTVFTFRLPMEEVTIYE